VEFLTRNQ